MSGLLTRCRAAWRMAKVLAPAILQSGPAATLPDGEAFPKRIFELDARGAAAPGGRTADYARLSRQLWARSWARDAASSPHEQWLRLMHLEVLRSQELELRLLAKLEADH